MSPFTLTRVGNGRTLVQEFPTKRAAALQVGYSIHDNGYGTKREAQEFSASFGKLPLGTEDTFGPYRFTITKG